MPFPSDAPVADARTGPFAAVLLPTPPATAGPDPELLWRRAVRPAIEAATWCPLRMEPSEPGGGLDLDRLVLCPAVVADVTVLDSTTAHAVGVHQGARPWTAVLLSGPGGRDQPLHPRADPVIRYGTGGDGGPDDPQGLQAAIRRRLEGLGDRGPQAPLHHLVDGPIDQVVAHATTDVFRDRARYADPVRAMIADARRRGVEALRDVHAELRRAGHIEVGAAVDLLLSFRAVEAPADVVDLVEMLPPPLAATSLVREQLGFALNRLGRRREAVELLEALVAERGDSSERCALLGRVHKDAWEEARAEGADEEAGRHLDRAIDAYIRGFESDLRDAYPGINAVVLMDVREPPDPRRLQLLPIVRFAVERRMVADSPDYWDHATLLELAVLADDTATARRLLPAVIDVLREPWEARTTAATLRRIRRSRQARGAAAAWVLELEEALERAAGSP